MQPYFEINLGFKTDVGRIRKNNEDYIKYFIPTDEKELKQNGCLFIVADGVGGAAKGEVASHFAGDTVIFEYYSSAELPPAERLAKAMQNASREIYDHSQKNGNFTRMATTMVAALILQNNLIVAHVGDSRLYLIREGKIKQITRDHSVVAEMVRNGAMTEEEARTSKAKNRLSRSIGGEADVHVDVSAPIPLNLGDRILLCSDGLTRYLDGEDLMAASQKGDVETVTKDLVKFANEQGGVDNISVILLEIVEKAKIRPKKPATRQTPPEKLGWDEAETEYPGPSSRQKKKIPVWVMIAGGIIVLGVIIYAILSNISNNANMSIIQSTGTVIPIVATLSATAETPTNTPTPITDSNVPTSTVPEKISDIATDSSESSENWECVYEVQSGSGDTVGGILNSFGLSFDAESGCGKSATDITYNYYLDCHSDSDGQFTCLSKTPYPAGNGLIGTENSIEWIIIYTSEGDKKICYIDLNKNIQDEWGKENCQTSLDGTKNGYIHEIGGNE